MLAVRAAGNLWRTQRYYPWTARRNGGMLESLKVGLSEGAGERLNRSYAYNYFGDITRINRGNDQQQLHIRWAGTVDRCVRKNLQLRRRQPADRFDYDANGNMTVRNKGLAGQQTLVWDAQNRLPRGAGTTTATCWSSTGMMSTEVASSRR